MGKYDEQKAHVLRVSQSLSARGFFGTDHGSAGNVSVLVEGEEAIVVTPSNIPYHEMEVDDICVVDFDTARIEAKHDPSVESAMHIACYKNREDVNAVIHTHMIYASIISTLNTQIPPMFDEVTASIGNEIALCPYALSGSPELVESVTSKLENRCHCYMLQNHGALTIGPDLDKTLTFCELFEKCAKVYYHGLATGKEITELPDMLKAGLQMFVTNKQDMEIERKKSLLAAK